MLPAQVFHQTEIAEVDLSAGVIYKISAESGRILDAEYFACLLNLLWLQIRASAEIHECKRFSASGEPAHRGLHRLGCRSHGGNNRSRTLSIAFRLRLFHTVDSGQVLHFLVELL